jgi:CheY-like chemotaxis protein
VIITADATMESAIEAVNHGAFSYLAKPFPHLTVDQAILRALECAARWWRASLAEVQRKGRSSGRRDSRSVRRCAAGPRGPQHPVPFARRAVGPCPRTMANNAAGEAWLTRDGSPRSPAGAVPGVSSPRTRSGAHSHPGPSQPSVRQLSQTAAEKARHPAGHERTGGAVRRQVRGCGRCAMPPAVFPLTLLVAEVQRRIRLGRPAEPKRNRRSTPRSS